MLPHWRVLLEWHIPWRHLKFLLSPWSCLLYLRVPFTAVFIPVRAIINKGYTGGWFTSCFGGGEKYKAICNSLTLFQRAEGQNGLCLPLRKGTTTATAPSAGHLFSPLLTFTLSSFSLLATYFQPHHLLRVRKNAHPWLLPRRQGEKVLRYWTQGPLSLQHVWVWWEQHHTLRSTTISFRRKIIGEFILKICLPTKMTEFPVILICWDFKM